mmetsp:Transcript_101117/g.321061  ORF Transcript_101117/g.321061 Transcript_101117/m.321061 type:complete len:271 (+) Transcript_101117:255-1067(+)
MSTMRSSTTTSEMPSVASTTKASSGATSLTDTSGSQTRPTERKQLSPSARVMATPIGPAQMLPEPSMRPPAASTRARSSARLVVVASISGTASQPPADALRPRTARLSPTWPTYSMAPINRATMQVVPDRRASTPSAAMAPLLASAKARLRAPAGSCCCCSRALPRHAGSASRRCAVSVWPFFPWPSNTPAQSTPLGSRVAKKASWLTLPPRSGSRPTCETAPIPPGHERCKRHTHRGKAATAQAKSGRLSGPGRRRALDAMVTCNTASY